MSYQIATDVYQGPFDLLLQMTMSDEVDIWDLQISAIIEAFIRESESLQESNIDLEVSTEFLLIASTLIEIKVKRLMPKPEVVDLDEELLAFEHRDLLLARLYECKTFKEVSQIFVSMIENAALVFPRKMSVEEPFSSLAPDPLSNTPLDRFKKAYIKVFTAPVKEEVSVVHLHENVISVKEAVQDILLRLDVGSRRSFKELMLHAPSKMHIVVNFLAILELYKQGYIEIDQPENLGDLEVVLLQEKQGEEIDVNADDWGEIDLEENIGS